MGDSSINFSLQYQSLYLSLSYIQFARSFNSPSQDHCWTYIFESCGIIYHLPTLIPCWDCAALELILCLT